jgi:hypothetical protein
MNAFKSPTKKVFDVSHPGSIPANPSSKPVIISNKPVIDDPMVAGQDDLPVDDTNVPTVDEAPTSAPDNFGSESEVDEKGLDEDVTESVAHDESVEVKEDEPGQLSVPEPSIPMQSSPNVKSSKKLNPFLVTILVLLIIGFTIHALMNLGYVPSVNLPKPL